MLINFWHRRIPYNLAYIAYIYESGVGQGQGQGREGQILPNACLQKARRMKMMHELDVHKIRSERWGCSDVKLFRFARACLRAVLLLRQIASQKLPAGLFPFPFWLWRALRFPIWGAELSLFRSSHPSTS